MAQTKIEQGLLKFTEATDYLQIPTGTTEQRPSSPANGYIRFNTTINDVEAYNGTTWTRMGVAPPTFTSVDYPGSATALDPAGGESLVINGTQFNTGITITIGGTTPSSITRNSSTQLTVTAPAKTAGTYDIVFTNTDGGTATATNAVSYNGVPAWTTSAGSLGSVAEGGTINVTVTATEPDGGTITYAVTSGSLPSGASLNTSTGAITGTAGSVSADTTSNFTITATDNENQSTARAFSFTITNILPSSSFGVTTYSGTGASIDINTLGFQPDLIWTKSRSTTYSHMIVDSSRGGNVNLRINTTDTEESLANISFDAQGYNLTWSGANQNSFQASGQTYVSYSWKVNGGSTSSNTDGSITSTVQANQGNGISIVTWTGNSSNATIGHGLSSAPEMIIAKSRTVAQNWAVYHKDAGATYWLQTNGNTGKLDEAIWQDTAPTSSVFSVNGNTVINSGNSIAYCFHSIDGFSKFGTYEGNGSIEGPIVETGFEPAFLMVKDADTGSTNWRIVDNKRSTANPRRKAIFPNLTNAEQDGSQHDVDFFSNGFQIKNSTSGWNNNNSTHIYMAFAADPDTTSPTLADSFNTKVWTGNYSTNSITGYGFKPDLVWIKNRDQADKHVLFDSIRGATKYISPSTADGETTDANTLTSFDNDGFTLGNSGLVNASTISNVGWAWKAGGEVPSINTDGTITSITSVNQNAGFSIVRYPGSGANNTVGHGLSSTPEMIIIKTGDGGAGQNWVVGHTGLDYTNNETITLDGGAYSASWNYFNATAPTSSVFSLGTGSNTGNTNSTGRNYMAYCFHSVSGFSKIGSYSGGSTGSGNVITTGFQPDWIIIHIKGATDDWPIIDSVRGDGASSRRLIADLNDAERAATSIWFPTSTGFYFSGTGTSYNASGQDYIYAAFKIN